jgi:hypothetical protein
MAFERTPKQKKDAPESEINWIPSSPKIVSTAVVDVEFTDKPKYSISSEQNGKETE